MPLKNYTLRPPQVVIQVDNRDPYVSWQNHLDRTYGLRGGVDIVALTPVPVYARTAGTMVQMPNDGTAGNSCRFYHRDNPGWKDVFSHLSSYKTPKNPQGLSGFEYEAGDIVAYTGATGGVAPHLHWHLLDPGNVRRNPWDYFSPTGSTSGEDETPIDNQEEEEEMANSGFYWKRTSDGRKVGLVINTDSGFISEWSGTSQSYDNAVASAFKTGTFATITEGHRNVLARACAQIQARSGDDDVASALDRINRSIVDVKDEAAGTVAGA